MFDLGQDLSVKSAVTYALIFLPFHTVHGVLKARILKWFAIPFSSGPHSVIQRTDLLEKTLMLGKIEGRWRRGQQRMRWLHGITESIDMGLGGLRELVIYRKAWHATVYGVAKSQTRLSN